MSTALYISYDGMTDPLGQSQVIPYLKGLSQAGFFVILISFEKESQAYERGNIQKELSEANIVWKPLRYHKRPALPATLVDLIIGTLFTFIYCKKYAVQLIHCRGHYLTSLMAYLIRPFHKHKYVFDMRGFWADERIEGGLWDLSNLIQRNQYKFFKRLEKTFINKADQIITLTQVAKDYVELHYILKREIVVIPCSTDLELFSQTPAIQDAELNIAKQEGKIILVYLGSIGTWYMLPEMLQFFSQLKQEKPSVFFLLTPEHRDTIIYEAKKTGLQEKDLIIRKASRKEVPAYLSAADAGIFFIKPVFSKSGSSPTKHGEMLGCRLPIVVNAGIGDLDKIISQSNTGVIISDFTKDKMKEGVIKLLQLIEEEDRSRYRMTAQKYYSLNLAIDRYINIYTSLLR